jgi:hypothetical protein
MWPGVLFILVLVVVSGGSFALTVRRSRRWRRMTEEERARSKLANGGSVTAPLIAWLNARRTRR